MALFPRCAEEHAKLIAGKCPWCGSLIMNGQPVVDIASHEERLHQVKLERLKLVILSKVVQGINLASAKNMQSEALRRDLRLVVERVCEAEKPDMDPGEREQVVNEVLDLIFQQM